MGDTPFPSPANSQAQRGTGDWFFLLRLPEAPADTRAQSLYRERLDSWLVALRLAKFQPLRLTDALNTLTEGKPLPAGGVVLVVDPGMRRTYDCLRPVLAKYHWPAVWLTHRQILDNPDTTYISPHQARMMEKSGRWELAFYHSQKDSFFLDPGSPASDTSPWQRALIWSALSSRRALNRGRPSGVLRRIDLNLSWTGRQLVVTLLSETPVRNSARLTIKPFHHRLLGLAVEIPTAELPSPFRLEAPPELRYARVDWPGTRGLHNMELQLNVASWVGEVWALLRSDPLKEENVRVGFKEGVVFVELNQLAQKTRIARWPLPSLLRGPLHSKITLVDRQLTLAVNGQAFPPVILPADLASEDGVVQLYIQDKVRGAAQASDVELTLNVLDTSPARSTPSKS